MPELILALIPLAFVAAAQPPQLIAQIVLLQTQNGTANGWAYFSGVTLFRLTLGVVFWVLISNLEAVIEGSGGRFDIFVGAMLTVLGFLLLIYALRQAITARDADDAAASWMQKLQTTTPRQSFLVGVAFLALDPKDWLVDISAIDLIAAADLSAANSLLAYLTYIFLAQLLLLIPLVMLLANAQKSQATLSRLNAWLERNERWISLSVAILIGLYFLFAGLDLLGI